MNRISLLFLCVVISLSCNYTLAQDSDVFKQARKNNRLFKFNKELRYTTVGVGVNAINYFGDLSPRPGNFSTDISFTRAGFGLMVNRRIASRVFLRGSFNWATMRGDDFESADPEDPESRDRYVRNLQFRNRIFELSGTAIFDLIRNHGFYVKRARFTPYIFAGVAVFHHNPQAKVPEFNFNGTEPSNIGDWVDLQPLGTEGQNNEASGVDVYHKVQISIPAGLGVRFKLNKNFDLAFEMGYRILFFDYIDDVSTEYPDYGLLDNDLARTLSGRSSEPFAVVSGDERNAELLQTIFQSRTSYVGADNNSYTVASDNLPGARRGDPNDNDWYVVTSLQLTYVIGSPIGKPKFR